MTAFRTDKYFVIVAYDIVKNRARTRVMKLLKGMGFHVQKSVFECILNKRQIEWLRIALIKEIDEEMDTVRMYYLPLEVKQNMEIIGIGELTEPAELILV